MRHTTVTRSTRSLLLAAAASLLTLPPVNASPVDESVRKEAAQKTTASAGDVVEWLRTVTEGGAGDARDYAFHQLCHAGAAALPLTRKARDAATNDTVRATLAKAAKWQLADRLTPTLQAGLDTQLTFDGQFAELKREGEEGVDALFALLESEDAKPEIRIAASRAIADVGSPALLPRVRLLYYDILFPAYLREQMSILLAIFGDTHTVHRDIERLKTLAASEVPRRIEAGNRELANLYYRTRNYKEAVVCYERVLSVWEDWYKTQKGFGASAEDLAALDELIALHYYNAACSNSLNGSFERSKKYLKEAIRRHAAHFENLEKDGDLAPLRKDPSYAEFREELEATFDEQSL